MLLELLKETILIPITLFPIINPLSITPVFANMLSSASPDTEKRVARQVGVNCWFLLMGAIFTGSHVLAMFGISLPIVRIGGGILVAVVGWRLLGNTTQDSAISKQVAKHYPDEISDDEWKARSFYPISFPLIVGPGTMAASITLGANTPTGLVDWTISAGSIVSGAALTALGIYLCCRYASTIVRILGKLGTMVLLRLSAFMLLCIGIQIVWSGVTGLLTEIGLVVVK
jgi:multiple antibiotic resistance protein